MQAAFRVYNSSAGSGKTYTLTKEYLKLALCQQQNTHFSPDYFRHILAITFTNDAANEMKSRVLNTLRLFTEGQPHPMLQAIATETGFEEEALRKRAQAVFFKIIYHYSDFAISTIDSFFNRVTAAFTQELNVPFNYEIDLETDVLLKAVIDSLISRVGQEHSSDLTKFMVEYVHTQIESGQSWKNIHRNLHNFSKTLLQEKSIPILEAMKDVSISDFKAVIERCEAFLQSKQAQIYEMVKQGQALFQAQGLSVQDFSYKETGVGGYFDKILKAKEKDLLDTNVSSRVKSALEENQWYSKNAPKAAQIDAIAPALKELIENIEAYKSTHISTYKLSMELLRHFHAVSLINEIQQQYKEITLRNGIVHISETTKKIADIIQTEPVPFIFERLGERYHHLLIDEFQDTSSLQWHNLLPLIENNLSQGYFNMLVGDAKQSIYRWRGGEMEQLVHIGHKNTEALAAPEQLLLQERYENIFNYLDNQNLQTNYRSTREIIDFNNDFFESQCQRSGLIEQVYADTFRQQSHAGSPTGGGVRIQFLERENYEEESLQKILQAIQEAQSLGFKPQNIAVLCRNNDKAKQIATFLKEQHYAVMSADSLLLASDEKVNFLIALLKVIYNPENNLAKSELVYLFYKIILGEIPDAQANAQIRQLIYGKEARIEDLFGHLAEKGYLVDFHYIQALGIYEILEELLLVFQLYEQHPQHLEYLFRFMDWVLEFSTRQSNHLADLLEEWERKKSSLCVSAPANNAAITITTIHKSKGLEYPVVIFPFVDWRIDKPGSSMWVNLENSPLPIEETQKKQIKHTLLNLNAVNDPNIDLQIQQEKQKIEVENLNLLYVAFTRPVYLLYIFSKTPQNGTISQWLRSYLDSKSLQEKPEGGYLIGSFVPQIKEHAKAQTPLFALEDIRTVNTHKKWRI